jgi:hypothetical protein
MTEKFYIGSEIKEIFSLWLQSRITFFTTKGATCYFMEIADNYKKALASLGDSNWLDSQYDTYYSLFVSNLCKNIK